MRALFILIPALGAFAGAALLSILIGFRADAAMFGGLLAFLFMVGVGISATKARPERGEGKP